MLWIKLIMLSQVFFLLNEDRQKFIGKDLAETLYYCSSAIRNVKHGSTILFKNQKRKKRRKKKAVVSFRAT